MHILSGVADAQVATESIHKWKVSKLQPPVEQTNDCLSRAWPNMAYTV